MSEVFEKRKVSEKEVAYKKEASSFYSSAGITTDYSSSDESDDTKPSSVVNSRSSWIVRDRNNNNDNKRYRIKKMNWVLPPIEEITTNSNPVDADEVIISRFQELTLNSNCESLTINKIAELYLNDDPKRLAGVVTSVAKVIGLIVVKPPISHDVLLYIGSPVFLISKDVYFGWIIDVFGPACEPFYCVKPVDNAIELVHEGTELFYSPDHPHTAFLCLKREDNNRYTVIYSSQYPRKMQNHGNDHEIEGDSWSYTPQGKSSNYYQSSCRRRRYECDTRKTSAYRNKYRDNNPHAFRSMQPKHSYFDY